MLRGSAPVVKRGADYPPGTDPLEPPPPKEKVPRATVQSVCVAPRVSTPSIVRVSRANGDVTLCDIATVVTTSCEAMRDDVLKQVDHKVDLAAKAHKVSTEDRLSLLETRQLRFETQVKRAGPDIIFGRSGMQIGPQHASGASPRVDFTARGQCESIN